jgi:biofilm PGA synthesis N-glycosyltransferase PgaC
MISLIVISIITACYIIIGNAGMSMLKKERASLKMPESLPLVSIIIPAYKSQAIIEDTLRSIKSITYPRKEIIIVNDYPDSTASIARTYGARVIENRERIGKPAALNKATNIARGELLFFIDSDTTVNKDCIDRLVPWFSKGEVSVVMPKYLLKNKTPVTKLADVENIFMFALLRVHMFFRSLAGFRGCSVMIRKSVLMKHPWPETLMEDNHLAATLSSKGHRIIWEPLAITHTSEPETLKEIRRQKKRWGEGAYLAFRHHLRFYARSPQFMIFFYPYFALGIATGILLLLLLLSPIFFPAIALPIVTELVLIFISMYFHTLIFLYLGGGKALPVRTFKFMTFYFSVMTYSYFRGVLSGIKRKKRGGRELNFRYW